MALDVYRDWLKITSKKRPVDYYTLFGLEVFEDDRKVIQKNYRQRFRLARQYSTGKFAEESQDLLDELARAMLTLTDPSRKADYDQKLGRKTQRPPTETRPFERILIDEGVVNPDQLKDAQNYSQQLGVDLRTALIQKGYAKWEQTTRLLAQHYNMPYVNPLELNIAEDVKKLVTPGLAAREQVFPLLVDEQDLLVAVSNALNVETLDMIRFEAGMPVRGVLCSPLAIRKLIEEHYGSPRHQAKEAAQQDAGKEEEQEEEEEEEEVEGFSLATFLWKHAKWLGLVFCVMGAAVGYIWGILGAVVGVIVALVLLTILLFTLG